MANVINRAIAYNARTAPADYNRDWLSEELRYVQAAIPVVGIRTITVATTQLNTDRLVLVNTGGGAVTYTLLAPTNAPIFPVTIKKTSADATNVTIAGTIDGVVNLVFGVQYTSYTLQSDGTSWWIV